MATIIMEGVLFVALVATMAALLFFVVKRFTPIGVRLRQTQNRRQIEQAAELACPVHGPHDERQLVRLPSGERICPECFQEVVHGKLD